MSFFVTVGIFRPVLRANSFPKPHIHRWVFRASSTIPHRMTSSVILTCWRTFAISDPPSSTSESTRTFLNPRISCFPRPFLKTKTTLGFSSHNIETNLIQHSSTWPSLYSTLTAPLKTLYEEVSFQKVLSSITNIILFKLTLSLKKNPLHKLVSPWIYLTHLAQLQPILNSL